MKRMILAAFALIALSGTVIAGGFFNEFYLKKPAAGAKEKTFAIAKDSGVNQISRDLKNAGLIENSFIFETYVWLAQKERQFRAGVFLLKEGMNMTGVAKILTSGGGKEEKIITIIPGWTLRDIKKYLIEQGVKNMEAFDSLAGRSAQLYPSSDWSGDFEFLSDKPKNLGLEGYFSPDTYRIFADAGAEDVIRKALRNFGLKFDAELRAEAEKKKMTIFEVVTLASIVEREVRSEEDMAKVADVFLRRLALGMPLQADSTVNYVTERDTPAISLKDRELDSLWNTYKYRGLPKGPIGNPGLAAIKAVLEPEPNPYLYFLTTADGEVIYSRVLEEHNAAKRKYLK